MLKLYNSLTKKVEEFRPIKPPHVGVYTCGPTVYDYAHIGNFRTYTLADLLVRTLKRLGYTVTYVMNITDVGHLTSDSDTGEDKMEKGARREGKNAWEIAKFYTDAFLSDSKKLNLVEPDVRPKPTEHIQEQIHMVQTLLKKRIAYQIDDGIYFDTGKLTDYGKLTGQPLEKLIAGARVEVNPQKRNPLDFGLWKFSPKDKKRDMEWESPWGMGYPGWHIECSAMSMKYLGDQFDIHAGGMDLIPIHHTNEIAQSEATTGKTPFVRYWVHGQFILVDGQKMAKSKENFYKLSDVEAKGFDPLALRYLYLTAQYRTYLNFTWEALEGAQNALRQLRMYGAGRNVLSQEKLERVDTYRKKFDEALANDLNMPQALAVTWEVAKSNIPSRDKYDLLLDFDEVLGLHLERREVPEEIKQLVDTRENLRKDNKFQEADEIRKQIEQKGFGVEDTPSGPEVSAK